MARTEIGCAADRIECANRQTLFQHVSDPRGSSTAVIHDASILELWELVSVARHRDGPAAKRFRALNAELWAHQDAKMRAVCDKVGQRADIMRVQDADLDMYLASVVTFWEAISRGEINPIEVKDYITLIMRIFSIIYLVLQ